MKTPVRKRSAFVAWAASLPLALTIPPVVWMAGLIWTGDIIGNVEYCLAIMAVAMVIHLLSYLVIGLPIFLVKFKNPQSIIWMLPVALPSGVLLGCSVVLGFLLVQGGSIFETPALYLICGGYGLATAIAALLQRPTPDPS